MRYFKRRWEENRADQCAHWGHSVYYFEVDDEMYPVRQIELYDNGNALQYSSEHLADEYGMLGDQPLPEAEFRQFEITGAEFDGAWQKGRRLR